MNNLSQTSGRMTNYRWTICALLFFATTINYLDRQVLSLTWKDFIAEEFHWTNTHYGYITMFFTGFYSLCMLFAGRLVDWLDTKKGFLWAIGIWSVGACIHAFCGIATSGIVTGEWLVGFEGAKEVLTYADNSGKVVFISVTLFIIARAVLALGEAGNFPAAIKATAEYFPKKDRAFATSIFNAGASIGALFAPLSIPPLAKFFGWEMAFIVIGAIGFIWMGFWVFIYDSPSKSKKVNELELEYIEQDKHETKFVETEKKAEKTIPFLKCFTFKQTWAFVTGKFMTDGVWWFFLFWTPSYLNTQFGIKTSEDLGMALIFTLYAIVTILSIFGGKLPTIFINRSGQNPYAARMKAMLIFAFFPLAVLLAQPLGMEFAGLGRNAAWIPVLLISIGCAAHQAWSANLFSTIGDMFPKGAIATITGIGGMAGGVGSMLLQLTAGELFVFAGETNMQFLGFEGKPAGYFIIFCFCAIAYLIGWAIMKALVPKYKPIVV